MTIGAIGGTCVVTNGGTELESGAIVPGMLAAQLAAAGGDPVQTVMMLQLQTYRQQRIEERVTQVRERADELRHAFAAHAHLVKEAERMRTSAFFNAVMQTASLAATAYFKYDDIADAGAKKPAESSFWGSFLREAVKVTPDLMAAADKTIGFEYDATRHRLAANAEDVRKLAAGNEEEDAAGQVDELRRLESKILDMLEQTQRGRSRNEEAALRA